MSYKKNLEIASLLFLFLFLTNFCFPSGKESQTGSDSTSKPTIPVHSALGSKISQGESMDTTNPVVPANQMDPVPAWVFPSCESLIVLHKSAHAGYSEEPLAFLLPHTPVTILQANIADANNENAEYCSKVSVVVERNRKRQTLEGYIRSCQIFSVPMDGTLQFESGTMNLREKQDTQSKMLAKLEIGTEIQVLNLPNEDWAEVGTKEKPFKKGFIKQQFINVGGVHLQPLDISADSEKKFKEWFGKDLTSRAHEYKQSFQSAKSMEALFNVFETAHSLADTLEPIVCKKISAEDLQSNWSLTRWLFPFIPGIQSDLYAEGTALLLDVLYGDFLVQALNTPEELDEKVLYLLYLSTENGGDNGWSSLGLRNWDYGGCDQLGNGLYLHLLRLIDQVASVQHTFAKTQISNLREEILKALSKGMEAFPLCGLMGSEQEWTHSPNKSAILEEMDAILKEIQLTSDEKKSIEARKAEIASPNFKPAPSEY